MTLVAGRLSLSPDDLRALGRTGDMAAVAPLIDLISDSSGALVRVAALALRDLHQRHRDRFGYGDAVEAEITARGREPAVVPQLAGALSEADPTEQVAICFVLGVLRDPSTAPVLTALLDATPMVAQAAAGALKSLGDPHGEGQVLEGIRRGSSSHKRALLPFVSSVGGTPDVIQCLTDEDADLRVLACEALGRMGGVTAVGALFPLLADRDGRVSYAAMAAIQSLGSRETVRLAIGAAHSPDVRVRRAGLRILAHSGSSAALEVLLAGVHDPDEHVRDSALQGLPFMGDARALDALIAAANDPAGRTRASAMRGLGQCAGEPRASASLLRGLDDPDSWVRTFACQALGKLAFEPAAAAIAKLLDDAAGHVRVAAIEALSYLTSEHAMSTLKEAAAGEDSDIQCAAMIGLGVAKRADALPVILHGARSAEPATRLAAISALTSFRSPEVLGALATAAADSEEGVRGAALRFLSAMPGTHATSLLIGLLRRTALAEPVLSALSLHVEGRVAGLVQALESADDETAAALTSVLVRLRRPDAAAALVTAMSLANVAARKAAASALAVLAGAAALDALRKAASDDPEPEVRQVCSLLAARLASR
jgi:HEAT repeat protein